MSQASNTPSVLQPCPLCNADTITDAIDVLLLETGYELGRAIDKFPTFNSPHEGYAVIREELERELWEHVCDNTGRSFAARQEAIQIAAMALRYALDLCEEHSQPCDCAWCRFNAEVPAEAS